MNHNLKQLFFIILLLLGQTYLPIDASATAVQRKNSNPSFIGDGDTSYSQEETKVRPFSYRNKRNASKAAWIIGLFALGNYSSLYFTPFQGNVSNISELPIEGISKNNSSAVVPIVKDDSISVVLRTWSEDAATALVAAESALTQIPHLLELVIVTDQGSTEAVQHELINPLNELIGKSDKKIKFIVEEPFLHNGHIQQKYSKMMADTYTNASYILHLDSDGAITNWEDDCFLRDKLPINEFDSWENLPDSVRQWREGTAFLLGVEKNDVKYEYSRVNQHVYPRQLYKMVRDELEKIHGVSFKELFTKFNLVGTGLDHRKINGSILISDFNILGAFADKLGVMFSLNLGEGGKWRKICTTQCNARRWSNTCCDQFRHEQIENAKNHKPVKAHLVCDDYGEDHPCHCDNENNKINKGQRALLKKPNNQAPEGSQYFEPCITPTGTNGYKCGAEGYCYGSAIEDTCELITNWFDQQEDRSQFPDCKCTE